MPSRNLQPYKPIEVSFLGEQKWRYQSELDDVSYWRNNLVAASKRQNYLFIAVCSTIRVYTPKYPYQTIPTTPYTTLTSTASPTAAGCIDHQNPHAINSITVGELGFEEVLVSAHDDGDVCAWYTHDLRRIAFRLSVCVSAWGVALHKERRLLAVSANSHRIQVFELAIGQNPDDECEDAEDGLEDEGEEDAVLGDDHGKSSHNGSRKRRRRRRTESRSPDDSDGSGDDSMCTGCKRRRRKRSPVKDKIVKTLIGHKNNIPNISFLDDPSGRWLVGTSIDGMVILWDVLTERAVEECKMGRNSFGWSVLFLKPQAFKPVSTLFEALGKPAPLHTNHSSPEPRKIPISDIRTLPTDYYDPPTNQRSREAHAWDISPNPIPPTNNVGTSLQLTQGYDDEDDFWEEEEEESLQSSDDGDDDDAEVEVFIGTGGGHVEIVAEEESETDTSTSLSTATTDSQEAEIAASYHSAAASVTGAADIGFSFEDGDEGSNSGGRTLGAFGPVRVVELVQDSDSEGEKASWETGRINDNRRRKAHNEGRDDYDGDEEEEEEEKPAQPPISFIFSTTRHSCHLLTLTPSLTPTVICRFPLRQQHPPSSVQYLGGIDRLNMVHCIPDLSLIIAASQNGRAAIFRLTRVKGTFCMRLDTILPREDNEASERGRERRPTAALLGVAVGPVQERRRGRCGGVGVWGRRRWRLMMVYMDGTVVSYELGREEGIVEVGGVGGGLDGTGGFVMV